MRRQLLPGVTNALSHNGADTLVELADARLILQNVQLSSLSEGWIFAA